MTNDKQPTEPERTDEYKYVKSERPRKKWPPLTEEQQKHLDEMQAGVLGMTLEEMKSEIMKMKAETKSVMDSQKISESEAIKLIRERG